MIALSVGDVIVVRAWESHVQGEGRQRIGIFLVLKYQQQPDEYRTNRKGQVEKGTEITKRRVIFVAESQCLESRMR